MGEIGKDTCRNHDAQRVCFIGITKEIDFEFRRHVLIIRIHSERGIQ